MYMCVYERLPCQDRQTLDAVEVRTGGSGDEGSDSDLSETSSIDELVHQYSLPARQAAASAIVLQRWRLVPAIVPLYRLLELWANAVCLAAACAIVRHWVMVVAVLLLWYVPAVLRTGSLLTPLKYPVLLFSVDGFSLLRLHPEQKPARNIYLIYVLRVLLLLALFPLCSGWLPLPEYLQDFMADLNLPGIFSEIQLPHVCFGLLLVSMGGALIWLAVTVPMIYALSICGYTSPINGNSDEDTLGKIDALTLHVDYAANLPPSECRQALERLQKKAATLKLASRLEVAMNAGYPLVHMVVDIYNMCTFASTQYFFAAASMGLLVCLTMVLQFRAVHGGLLTLPHEARLTLERGLATKGMMDFLLIDKFIQYMPTCLIKVYALPFAADSTLSALIGFGSIASDLFGVVQFIYKVFDLGCVSGAH